MSWSFYDANGKMLQGVLAVSISATELATDAVTTVKIIDDAVTYAKLQNLATADRVLGSASTGVIGEVQIVPDMIASDAVTTAKIANDQVTLAKMAGGTDGNLITYDTSGDPAYVATGNDGQVLTSAGVDNPPAFETLVAGVGIGLVIALG